MKLGRFWLALLALGGPAQAQGQWTDLWKLFGTGETTLPGGELVYRLQDGKGTAVNVAVNFEMDDGALTYLELTAFRFGGKLGQAELNLLASDVNRLALRCFNISPERSAGIRSFLINNDAESSSIYHTAGTRSASRAFGPLNVAISKRHNAAADSLTVGLSRSGRPGMAPWVKTCTLSG